MDKDIFLKELINFIATNVTDWSPTVFKKKIKLVKNKSIYSEIAFDYIQIEKGFMVYLSCYNKELGKFFEKEMGAKEFLKNFGDAPKDYRNQIFSQNSISMSHYEKALPIITQIDSHDSDGILYPYYGKTIFDDVLKNLETYHFKIIRDMETVSPNILDYIKQFPSDFGIKENRALKALFVIESNNLSAQDEKVQALFEYDEMVSKNESKLFSPFDLIFGRSDFEQAIKQRILSR